MSWWQRNGLVGDPFDRISGIEEIELSSLIVETEIFRKYNNILITEPKNLLGKSIIVFGEFGSGRTTLFSYLKVLIHREGIDSFIIRLHGSFQDSSEIEKKFLNSLFFKLTGSAKEDCSLLEIIEAVRNKKHKFDKYFIFIDELHKNQIIKSSLEFLKNLQGIIEEINEEVSIGIMIAGRNEWRNEIKNNPLYSGTFAVYEEIGDMSLEDACTMIDKRIRYFHQIPETYSSFSLITQDAIAKIYSNEIKTPRALLRAISRFVEEIPSSVKLVTSSEIHSYIGKHKFSEIRNYLLKTSSVYNRLSKIEKIGNKGVQEQILTILTKIYNEPIIVPLHTSSGYDPNLIVTMLKNNLLHKKDMKIPVVFDNIDRESTAGGGTYIVLDEAIKSVFDTISANYQASPEDYLAPIFLNKEIFPSSSEDPVESIISKVESISDRLPQRLEVCKTRIESSIIDYKKVTNFDIHGIPKDKEHEFLITCESAMDNILKVYFAIREDVTDDVQRDVFLEKILLDCNLEELSELYQKIRLSKESGIIHLDTRDSITDLFFRAYRKVIDIIIGELDLGRFLALKSDYIFPNEMEILRDIRSRIFEQKDYINARLMIHEFFKEKMADCLNFNLSIVYGIDWYERYLSKDLASKIKEQKGSKIEYQNSLQEKGEVLKNLKLLNLEDIYEIIETKLLWDGIFYYVFGKKYNKIYLKRFFNDINDVLIESEDALNHKHIMNLFDRVLKLLVLMNGSIEFYFDKKQIILLDTNNEKSKILYGTKQYEKNDIIITKKNIEELEGLIKKKVRDRKFNIFRPEISHINLFSYLILNDKIVFSRCEGDKLLFELGINFTKIIYKHKLKSCGGKCDLHITNPGKNELEVQFSKPSDLIRIAPETINLDESKIDAIFGEIEQLSNYSNDIFELSKKSESQIEDLFIDKLEHGLKKGYHSSLVKLGGAIYKLVLQEEVRRELESCDLPINFIIDENLMVYPWELMYDDTNFLALKSLSGRTIYFKKKNLNRKKDWSRDGNIRFLIIGISKSQNEEESLPWVKFEIDRLREVLSQFPYIDLEFLIDEKATYIEVIKNWVKVMILYILQVMLPMMKRHQKKVV